jgi:nondiscriminating glutamyl-tRNA synthetase
LFARHNQGALVLRIEDTDVERSTRESEASLIEDLEWLGVDWDEGPVKGGEYGPYRQSERLELYQAAAVELIERGLAYPCFCTDEMLERKKKEAIESGKSPHYDGSCRGLAPDKIAAKRKQNIPEAIRFEVPEGKVTFDDVVRGAVELDTGMVGDFVIIRSNGLPTYNFAAAYDDHHMKITHVLRGEEHLPNTLRQMLIYRSMDAEPPVFGHVPLILAQDRSKLSKRHGASSVGELRAKGYLPGAAVNYLLLLGWSHPDDKERLSRQEMIDSFSVDRISKTAAAYDPVKLGWMNGLYIRDLSLDEWVSVTREFLPQAIKRRYDADEQKEILDLLKEKVEVLEDLDRLTDVFEDDVCYDDEAAELLKKESSVRVLTALQSELVTVTGPWSPETVKAAIKSAGERTGNKGKDLFFPVRAAITGKLHGPDLARVAALKGKDSVARLVARALEGRR